MKKLFKFGKVDSLSCYDMDDIVEMSFDLHETSKNIGLMRISLNQLKARGNFEESTNKKILYRDIKIMEWLLDQPNAEHLCGLFFKKRMSVYPAMDRAEVMQRLNLKWETK